MCVCFCVFCVLQVRRRSKACRADLREEDELVAIGDHVCAELNHAQAMMLIDSHRHTLNLRVKRSEHTDIDSTSGSRGQIIQTYTPVQFYTMSCNPTHFAMSYALFLCYLSKSNIKTKSMEAQSHDIFTMFDSP